MAIGRRKFLRWTAAGRAALASPLARSAPQDPGRDSSGELILGGGAFADPDTGAQRYVFSRVDLVSRAIALTDTDFLQVSGSSLATLDQTHMTRTFLSRSHIFNWNRLTATS